MKLKKIGHIAIALGILSIWFVWDFSQAGQRLNDFYRSYRMESEFDAITSATTKVAIVRSDDSTLAHPISVDDNSISYQTIEEMVRKAIKLAGGLWFVHPGDMVLLKPNIVNAVPSGSGEVTDVRVIKALIKIIDEVDPGNMEIVVGEGSPVPIDYELEYDEYYNHALWNKLWDVSGYQDLLNDPYLKGINFRLSNLNCHMPGPDWKPEDGWPADSAWKDLVLVDVPGGGQALPQEGKYWVHKDVLNANVFISVPVMKIHTTGITCALKNEIGIAPSTIYGFWKQMGVPQNNYQYKLVHEKQAPKWWTSKEIVDLASIAGIDFVVVDAIGCLEQQKEARPDGSNFVRMNTIIAGNDPVAVDNVCTRLMGMNPDDIEHITLAEKVGLGTNDPDKIHLKGADLNQTKRRFKKSNFREGKFGQGNRTWLLKGPYLLKGISDPIDYEFIANEGELAPKSGENGWSESVYFTDNRIDLKDYFGLNSGDERVSYAFCYFDAPKDQQAELWIGSDEALKIYINGQVAYKYDGTRSFDVYDFTNDKAMVTIKKGENRLLVKSLQKYGRYDFCLNICEPESNPDYDGNRVFGLKFKTNSQYTSLNSGQEKTIVDFKTYRAYPNPFNSTTHIVYNIPHRGVVELNIYNTAGQKIRSLFKGFQTPGRHSIKWSGENDHYQSVSTGVYFYRLIYNRQIKSQKLILIK